MARSRVVLSELGPQAARIYTHNRIQARIKRFTALEDLHADDRFLKPVPMSQQCLLHDEPQKAAQPFACAKGRTRQNFLELTCHGFRRYIQFWRLRDPATHARER